MSFRCMWLPGHAMPLDCQGSLRQCADPSGASMHGAPSETQQQHRERLDVSFSFRVKELRSGHVNASKVALARRREYGGMSQPNSTYSTGMLLRKISKVFQKRGALVPLAQIIELAWTSPGVVFERLHVLHSYITTTRDPAAVAPKPGWARSW